MLSLRDLLIDPHRGSRVKTGDCPVGVIHDGNTQDSAALLRQHLATATGSASTNRATKPSRVRAMAYGKTRSMKVTLIDSTVETRGPDIGPVRQPR